MNFEMVAIKIIKQKINIRNLSLKFKDKFKKESDRSTDTKKNFDGRKTKQKYTEK